MQTFDQHLTDLVQAGEVTFETAMASATNPSDFELKMRMFRRSSSTVRASTVAAADAASSPMPSSAAPSASGVDGMTTSGNFDFLGQ
jgi:twitching motility protein PilT